MSANEEGSGRAEVMATLQMLLLMSSFQDNVLPPELQEEVQAALENERLSDEELLDLVARVNSCLPDLVSANLDDVSFSEHRVASGPGFSIEVPDGWRVIEDYRDESPFGVLERPFIAVPAEAEHETNFDNADRIMYCTLSHENQADKTEAGIPEFLETLQYYLAYYRGEDASSNTPPALGRWAWEGRDGLCEIRRVPSQGGYEFHVWLYSARTDDFLRFVFYNQPEEEWEKGLALVRQTLATLQFAEDPRCDIAVTLEDATEKPVEAEELVRAFALLSRVFGIIRETRVKTAQYEYAQGIRETRMEKDQCEYAQNADESDTQRFYLSLMRAAKYVEGKAVPYIGKMLDAVEKQKELGLDAAGIEELMGYVDQLIGQVTCSLDEVGDDFKANVIASGVLDEDTGLEAQRLRFQQFAEKEGASEFKGGFDGPMEVQADEKAEKVEKIRKKPKKNGKAGKAEKARKKTADKADKADKKAAEKAEKACKKADDKAEKEVGKTADKAEKKIERSVDKAEKEVDKNTGKVEESADQKPVSKDEKKVDEKTEREAAKKRALKRARVYHEQVHSDYAEGLSGVKAGNIAEESIHRHLAEYLLEKGGALTAEELEEEAYRSRGREWKPAVASSETIDIQAVLGYMIRPESSMRRIMGTLGLSVDPELAVELQKQHTVEERQGRYYLWCQPERDLYAAYESAEKRMRELEKTVARGSEAEGRLSDINETRAVLKEELQQTSFFTFGKKKELKKKLKEIDGQIRKLGCLRDKGAEAEGRLAEARRLVEATAEEIYRRYSEKS